MNTRRLKYRSPQYLYDNYTQVHRLGWNSARIGLFLKSHLLLGHPKEKKKPARIDERSFQALIKYTNTTVQSCVIPDKTPLNGNSEFYTPTELIEMHPHVDGLDWTPTKVGIFLATRLLTGYRIGRGRSCFVERRSFGLLVNHAVGTIERRVQYIKGAKFPKPQ